MFKGSANAEPVSASGYYYVISAVAAGYLEPDEKAKEPYHIINPKNNKPMDQCVIKVEITEKGRPKVDFVEGAVGAYSAAAANEYYSIYSCE